MYDPIHDCYTKPSAQDQEQDQDQDQDQEQDPYQSTGAAPQEAAISYDFNFGFTAPEEGGHRDSIGESPEGKRKRNYSPDASNKANDLDGVELLLGLSNTAFDQQPANPSNQPTGVAPQPGLGGTAGGTAAGAQAGQAPTTPAEQEVDERELKRLKRFESAKDRERRERNRARDARVGAYSHRDNRERGGGGDDRDYHHHHRGRGRSPGDDDRHYRPGGGRGRHRQPSPHYRYSDLPPPPHLAHRYNDRDPSPEVAPPPRSPPRKFKRPGAVYSQQERDSLRKQQQQREAEKELKAANMALSRGVDEVVRAHYNNVPERGKIWRRTESKIRGLRSYNNWVKSCLIQKFSANEDYKPGQHGGEGLKVLDIGCGKGGDLLKWKSAPQHVDIYVGVDHAEVSIKQAKERFTKMREDDARRNRGRPSNDRFRAEFFILDAWGDRIDSIPMIADIGVDMNVGPREDWPEGGVDRWGGGGFDVVTMMFCLHYAFESEGKIRGMLRNISGALRKGGRFIGTIPSSDKIFENIEKHGADFGNSLYRVSFPTNSAARELPKDNAWRPAWGWKYSFFLEESVEDVPEYVVPWEQFRYMAREYGLQLEYKRVFGEIWEDEKNDEVLGPLSEKMGVKKRDGSGEMSVSQEEFEACKVYLGFCFSKI